MSIEIEAKKLKQKLEEDKNNPVKIALFGQPGAGKSSIINKLVGENVVETGVRTDVTVEAKVIEWGPGVLVDLPGYGTSKFPQNSYFKEFNLTDYDLFLCVFSGKFHEADTKFFKEIRDAGKTALLVRNQRDNMWEDGKSIEKLEEEVTADARKHVQANEKVYFTSCRQSFGLDDLGDAINNNLDASKKERWARLAKAYTQEALDRKYEACQNLITTKAALSAANALNPIPGADFAVDVGILVTLFKDIRDSYGLSDDKISKGQIVQSMGPVINNIMRYGTKEGIMILLRQFAGREIVKNVTKYIPFVGQAIAASIGFGIIKYAGESYLEDCHKVAKAFLEEELKG